MESSRGHGKRSLNIKIEEEEEEEEEDEDEEEEEDEDGSRSSSSSFNNSNNSEDERRKRVMMKSNSSSSTPAGNKRGSGAGGSTVGSRPCCQADGCNADLSDLKQYYRRHKVCDFHSKAPAVLVAGLHQRFCQQCSKFHSLSEFDDSKRSCRRRLAGHNERRRKAIYQGELPT